MMMRTLCLVLLTGLLSISGWSQKGYQEVFSTSDFSVKSRWKPSELKDKNSPEAIFLSIENKSEASQQVVFILTFFLDGKRIEETEIQLCVPASKKKFGRKDSLAFLPDYWSFQSDEAADFGKGKVLEVEIEDFSASDDPTCD